MCDAFSDDLRSTFGATSVSTPAFHLAQMKFGADILLLLSSSTLQPLSRQLTMRAFTALFSLATLALGVIATPSPDAEAKFELVKRQCGGGSVQCCNNVQSSSSTTFSRVRPLRLLLSHLFQAMRLCLQSVSQCLLSPWTIMVNAKCRCWAHLLVVIWSVSGDDLSWTHTSLDRTETTRLDS